MTKLTQENYFEINNGVLTRSKIKDFLIDKNYFYRKHVLGEIEKQPKKAFQIGSIVDELLTMLDSKEKYKVLDVDLRTKAGKEAKADAEASGYELLKQDDYEFIMNIASAVEETDVYQMIIKEDYVKQGILQAPMDLGEHFDSLAIMIDFYKIDGDTCIIIDLKTTNSVDNRKFFYSAQDYWYFMQMGIATYLFEKLHPEIKKFKYYNLAVEKTKNIYPVKVFELAESRVRISMDYLHTVLNEIKDEKEFKKFNPSLDNATLIGEIDDELI